MSQHKKRKCKPSSLLTPEENEEIMSMLQHKCISLETTVIQLYRTKPPNHSEWIYDDCGILCFIQDAKRKCYFFRLFCLMRKQMIWEHKLQKDIDYTCLKTFLSSFHGDECIYGFNFACTTEASTFNTSILETIAAGCKIVPNHERKRKSKLSKKDISVPIEPQHTFHIGFKNMDVLKLSAADIESFFKKKNINKKMLLEAKPMVVDSSVTPISIFHNDGQQTVNRKSKLSSSTFSTFHDIQQKGNSTSNELNHPYRFPKRTSTKLPDKDRPIPPPKPLRRPSNLSHSLHDLQIRKENVSVELPTAYNKNITSQIDIMSIENSLAVLNEISDYLNNIDDKTTNKLPFQENQPLKAQDQKLKQILERRIQVQSYSDSSSESDNDDDWDD